MDEYRHHVSGFFARREEAERAISKIVERGLPRKQLHIFGADSAQPTSGPHEKSNEALKDMVVDGTIGAAVGTAAFGLAEVALVAANVTLFIASPLIAPLAMLGWGASLGALIGATIGSESKEVKEGWFSDLISDAIASGQVVLVAVTKTEQETAIAREVIKASVGDYKDVSKAKT